MPLPTSVNAGHQAAITALDEVKAGELIRTVRLIKDLCEYAVGETASTPTRVYRLLQLQSSLFRHKNHITSEGLVTLGTRTVIASNGYGYQNANQVQQDVQAASAAFNALTVELENVIAVARTAGQIVDTNPTTGELQEALVSVADTANLRAAAQAVIALLG